MVSISIPEGYVLVRPRSVETATALLAAADEIKADRKLSVRTVQGGYHVLRAVAEEYQKSFPDAEVEADGIVEGVDEAGETESPVDAEEAPEPLPVTEDSTHAEIDAYAKSLGVSFPANTNRAEKIQLLEAARQPKNDDAE